MNLDARHKNKYKKTYAKKKKEDIATTASKEVAEEIAPNKKILSIAEHLNKNGWRASRERLRHAIQPIRPNEICPQDHRHTELQLKLGIQPDQPDLELHEKFVDKFGKID